MFSRVNKEKHVMTCTLGVLGYPSICDIKKVIWYNQPHMPIGKLGYPGIFLDKKQLLNPIKNILNW